MVSIINRTGEDQTKIIDKGAKNKFKWLWLEKFVTVEIEKKSHKIMLAYCIFLRRRFISTKQIYKKVIHTIQNTLYTKEKK